MLGADGRETARLCRGADGVWRGNQLVHERVPVELYPMSADERAAASRSEPRRLAKLSIDYEPV